MRWGNFWGAAENCSLEAPGLTFGAVCGTLSRLIERNLCTVIELSTRRDQLGRDCGSLQE